jgi:protein TonB
VAAAWALAHVRLKDTGEEPVAYDEAPRLLRQTRPIFPYEVRQRGIQGVVVVEFIIDERGDVAYAEIRESIPALDDAAVACVKEWRFAPAKKAGKPIAAGARAPMTFRITK